MSHDTALQDQSNIGSDLRLVLGKLVRRVREETLPDDLTWPQMQVMARIDREGPATVTTLAKFAGVRSQSMGATVADLVASCHLITEPDPDDRRAVRVSLTDRGHTAVLAGRNARADWLNRAIRERLSAREQTRLSEAVSLLQRLVD